MTHKTAFIEGMNIIVDPSLIKVMSIKLEHLEQIKETELGNEHNFFDMPWKIIGKTNNFILFLDNYDCLAKVSRVNIHRNCRMTKFHTSLYYKKIAAIPRIFVGKK